MNEKRKTSDAAGQVPTSAKGKLREVYDYIIVGAGSAGCAVARRLIDNTNATVLLLEGASDGVNIPSIREAIHWPENIGSIVDYKYQYVPSHFTGNNPLILPRGKVLGGSGSINGMVWARGHQDDYNGWSSAGNTGWDYKSVLPFFKRIEDWEDGESDFHGASGPIRIERTKPSHIVSEKFIDAAKSFGMPFLEDANGPSPEGVGQMAANIRNGLRCSPFNGYLEPILNSERLTVLTNAQVFKLAIQGDLCTGVEFAWFSNKFSIRAETEVILTAGVIESPKLLMLSGIGPAEELIKLGIQPKANLKGVGKNLQDHVILQGIVFEAEQPLDPVNNNLCGGLAYWKSAPRLNRPDLMIVSAQVPFVSQTIASKYTFPSNCFALLPALVQVNSRGSLKLTSSKYSAPLNIAPNLLGEQSDVDALVNGVELCLEIAAQPDLKKLIKKIRVDVKNKKDILDFIRDAAGSYTHPVGTCSMGINADAVVNPSLQVHGLRGLRIADASVMPAIPAGNTNAPTLMIAEYASHLLLNGGESK